MINDLKTSRDDIIIKKRRFSAFFRTDLDLTLRRLGYDTVWLCGMTAQICVLATAPDGLQHDLKVVLLRDGILSHKTEVHSRLMDIYKNTVLSPLLRVVKVDRLLEECGSSVKPNYTMRV